MGCRLVAVQDLNDRRRAAALHALLNIFDAIIEEDDIIRDHDVVKQWAGIILACILGGRRRCVRREKMGR